MQVHISNWSSAPLLPQTSFHDSSLCLWDNTSVYSLQVKICVIVIVKRYTLFEGH